MTQDRQAQTLSPAVARPLARPGFERPVDHLHLDRRTRVWRRHGEMGAEAGAQLTADPGAARAVPA